MTAGASRSEPTHDGPGQVPQQRATSRDSWEVELAPASDRRVRAARVMVEAAARWGLPERRLQFWLLSAADLLSSDRPLVLYVQLDRVSQLATFELWSDGHVVFGIDDWIGPGYET